MKPRYIKPSTVAMWQRSNLSRLYCFNGTSDADTCDENGSSAGYNCYDGITATGNCFAGNSG